MAITGAITAGIGALAGAYSAVSSTQAAAKSRKQQRGAQEQAIGQTLRQERKDDVAARAAQQNAPDPTALLTAEQQDRLKGSSPSILTGSGGVDPNRLKLGRTGLLGA